MTNTTMNTGAASLLPCPFCGCSASPELKGNGIGDNWLECVECGASTRLREDGAGSVKDWNRRASTPQSDAAPSRDVAQLADWLLIDPQTGKRLTFAGPLERDFLGMSRVKMASADGENVWTLTAGLKEGYLTADERAANLSRIAEQEREEAREPSLEQLREMAYLLDIVPRGEVVCVQFLDVLRKQYRAAMEASGV